MTKEVMIYAGVTIAAVIVATATYDKFIKKYI